MTVPDRVLEDKIRDTYLKTVYGIDTIRIRERSDLSLIKYIPVSPRFQVPWFHDNNAALWCYYHPIPIRWLQDYCGSLRLGSFREISESIIDARSFTVSLERVFPEYDLKDQVGSRCIIQGITDFLGLILGEPPRIGFRN